MRLDRVSLVSESNRRIIGGGATSTVRLSPSPGPGGSGASGGWARLVAPWCQRTACKTSCMAAPAFGRRSNSRGTLPCTDEPFPIGGRLPAGAGPGPRPGPRSRAGRGSPAGRRAPRRRRRRSHPPDDGGAIRIGTASWTDPTMTARGVFYPDAADTAEERLAYYAEPLPDRRGRRDLLRAAVATDGRALGRAHAARLHLRHQGPRADDRPADRDEAPAQGSPRGAARRPWPRSRGSTPRTCPTTCASRSGRGSSRGSSRFARPASSARSCSSTHAGSSPARRIGTRSRRRPAGLRDAGLRGAVEFRSASWFNEKNIDRTLRFLGDRQDPAGRGRRAAGFQVECAAARRGAITRARDRSASTAVGRRPGRRRAIQTVERFRYLYDREELADWAPRVREIAAQAAETHVLFNNCYANYGATNALELAQLLLDLEATRG